MGLLCTRPGSGESSGQERRVGLHNEGWLRVEGDEGGLALGFSQPSSLVLFFLAARFGEGDNRDKELNPFLWVQSFGAGWKRARLLGPHSSRSGMGLWQRESSALACLLQDQLACTHTHMHTQKLAGLYESSSKWRRNSTWCWQLDGESTGC